MLDKEEGVGWPIPFPVVVSHQVAVVVTLYETLGVWRVEAVQPYPTKANFKHSVLTVVGIPEYKVLQSTILQTCSIIPIL